MELSIKEKNMNHLVIAPHPDDDVIGCGGTIAKYIAQGDEVHVIYLTCGDIGINNSDPIKAAMVRVDEAITAANILGVSHTVFWYQQDGAFQTTSHLVKKLCDFIIEYNILEVLVTNQHEAHVDHAEAYSLVIKALDTLPPYSATEVTLTQYEVWTPLLRPLIVNDISAYASLKRAAILAHKSQIPNSFAEGILALNMYRGLLHGPNMLYAEAFA